MKPNGKLILSELKVHAPFTALGTLAGIALLLSLFWLQVPQEFSAKLFGILHPSHVFLSALATTAMYRAYGRRGFVRTLLIGYFGSVGIATLSDCLIPFAGEWMLGLPNRGLHLGFIEHWQLVNSLALAGILLGAWRPHTLLYHGLHVGVSTGASLFHILMALGIGTLPGPGMLAAIAGFLFLAVWIPCCTSDIVFPLWFAPPGAKLPSCGCHSHRS